MLESLNSNYFSLFLITSGNSYKFQAGSRMNAMLWFKHLSAACQSNKQQVSVSLPDSPQPERARAVGEVPSRVIREIEARKGACFSGQPLCM